MASHIFQEFDKELEDIRARVLAMGGLVEEQLAKALQALGQSDAALAEEVASSDYAVNAMEVSLDEECTEILARRQPAASDLRLVLTVIRTITDLERIGDKAEKIGRLVMRLIENESPKSYYIHVLDMGARVQRMLHGALDAFARMDAKAALSVADEDAEVDRANDAIMRQLVTYMMEDPRSITRVLDVVWTVRALERIGDHAHNLCQSVIYLVKGYDVRHVKLEDIARVLREED